MSFNSIGILHKLKIMFKVNNAIGPVAVCDLKFVECAKVSHDHFTRNAGVYINPKNRFQDMINVWNNLDINIRNVRTLNNFLCKVKNQLIDS